MTTDITQTITDGYDRWEQRGRTSERNLIAAYLFNGNLDKASRAAQLDSLTQISDGTDVDLCLAQLAAAEAVAKTMKAKQTMAVLDARALGATWEDIGDALGLTKQAAQQRYRSLA